MAFEFMTTGFSSIIRAYSPEFLILDTEHCGNGIETVKQQIASASGLYLYPIARVPAARIT